MIFSELYSVYYSTVAEILAAAVKQPLQKGELRDIIEKNAFGESILNIAPAFEEERWQLLRADGSTPLKHAPKMPLTLLEKRWINAVAADPRIKLFTDEEIGFPGIAPLFTPEDISVFDKYSDGDPFGAEAYIKNFRTILCAVKEQTPLRIRTADREGRIKSTVIHPERLEYSEKDDKFRLIGRGCSQSRTVNLARITECTPFGEPFEAARGRKVRPRMRSVEFELYDRRNAAERVLLHFAHFEKQAERLDDGKYKVTVSYDKDDEIEILIRILSFGPMVKVTAPEHFVGLIKQRLQNQKSCEH